MVQIWSGLTSQFDWRVMLAIAVASFAAGIIATALFRDGCAAARRGRMVSLALNNMTQGVVMFDAAGYLVVCNKRYLEIYGLSPDIVKPGATLADIVRHRAEVGSLDRDAGQYSSELMIIMSSGKPRRARGRGRQPCHPGRQVLARNASRHHRTPQGGT